MENRVRIGIRIPKTLNELLKQAADADYMTKNQKAVDILRLWAKEQRKPDQ